MLTHLHIRELVIVDFAELEFQPAMTVLTGETGAGKSILIDALGLALGERADPSLIRAEAERAEIVATFDVSQLVLVQQWLREQELDDDNDCILRRVIPRQGRSKGYINGRPVPMQALQDLGNLLVDIHGQHAHQSLLHSEHQRELLDDHAEHPTLVAQTAAAFQNWRAAERELQQLEQAAADREARLDLLRYQVHELSELRLQPDELDTLNEEHARLAHVERLQQISQDVLIRLYERDEGAVHSELNHCIEQLTAARTLDSRLAGVAELLDNALIQVQETASELRDYAMSLEADPQALNQVEERLAIIQDLARKHRVTPEEIPALAAQLAAELEQLENTEVHRERLREQVTQLAARYQASAQALTASRNRAAQDLEEKVTSQIQQLGMPHAQFRVQLLPLGSGRESAAGQERVVFEVAVNPGQTPQPLNKVASGGELSRISLAIQVIAAQGGRVPTLIFDEVDVGIGGRVAEIVGRLLRTLGKTRQVLCVTHLPQVASQGHYHLQVRKRATQTTTQTTIAPLGTEERVEEIARMLGGIEITSSTLAHAREMLDHAGTL